MLNKYEILEAFKLFCKNCSKYMYQHANNWSHIMIIFTEAK